MILQVKILIRTRIKTLVGNKECFVNEQLKIYHAIIYVYLNIALVFFDEKILAYNRKAYFILKTQFIKNIPTIPVQKIISNKEKNTDLTK